VNQAENLNLALTFSENELSEIVKEMKSDMAPGPDGFPVAFFQKCWPLVKHGVLHILNDFILGRIDIARINYGVLSLIPKVPGADKISQFRPIALINVIFKIVSKAFARSDCPSRH
jgi:mannosylglycoprotein endo-beta-mannosidase